MAVYKAELSSYRADLVDQRLPQRAAAEVKGTRMPELLGVSMQEFRPVAEMRGLVDYLRFATELLGLREDQPLKN